MDDFPLFAGLEKSILHSASIAESAVTASVSERSARLFVFPPHRDVRVIGRLLDRWMGLRRRFEYDGAFRVFEQKHWGPIRSSLVRAGMTPRETEAEFARIQHAMAAMNDRRRASTAEECRSNERR